MLDPLTKVLIVEDNVGFKHILSVLLKSIGISQFQTAPDYEQGLAIFQKFEPDICIFDIDLGHDKPTGIHLAEKIRSLLVQVPIIYLTANYSEDFYYQTRHTSPCGFMNKELSKFKLEQVLDIALLHQKHAKDQETAIKLQAPPHIIQNSFFFKIGDIYKAFRISDISYFYADNKLTYARVGNRNYPTNVQLITLEDEFSSVFARIHKTYLVNIEHITAIQPKENTIQIGSESLPIGYAYRKTFLNRLNLLR